jgi:hypothetical protein
MRESISDTLLGDYESVTSRFLSDQLNENLALDHALANVVIE